MANAFSASPSHSPWIPHSVEQRESENDHCAGRGLLRGGGLGCPQGTAVPLSHRALEKAGRERNLGRLDRQAEKDAESEELARLRAENKKLKTDAARLESRNEKLAGELGKTKTALDIAGKAFALLQDISSSADSGTN
ncbi:hypothetical protein ABZ297_35050 [Nonomuraea sp. NPDC005983]|uniref:hypothetical protein n=1 Tax=Nonomuraea sp. NPDC005983 TaxID=3155595 RepID=UPI0033BD997F